MAAPKHYTTKPDPSWADLEGPGLTSVFAKKPEVSTLRIATYRDPAHAQRVVDLLNSLLLHEVSVNPFTGEVTDVVDPGNDDLPR